MINSQHKKGRVVDWQCSAVKPYASGTWSGTFLSRPKIAGPKFKLLSVQTPPPRSIKTKTGFLISRQNCSNKKTLTQHKGQAPPSRDHVILSYPSHDQVFAWREVQWGGGGVLHDDKHRQVHDSIGIPDFVALGLINGVCTFLQRREWKPQGAVCMYIPVGTPPPGTRCCVYVPVGTPAPGTRCCVYVPVGTPPPGTRRCVYIPVGTPPPGTAQRCAIWNESGSCSGTGGRDRMCAIS